MHLVKLRALRPLRGSYGGVGPGDCFTTNDRDAADLEARGLAERFRPVVVVEPKMVAAPENKAVAVAEDKTGIQHRRKRGRR